MFGGNQSGRGGHHQHQQKPRYSREYCPDSDTGYGIMLHLVEGAVFSAEIVSELREMLPSLPAGAYYLSSALKKKLLLELFKFYSAWDARHPLDCSDGSGGLRANGDDVEVVIGSPRDTPFMRRKALESVQKQKIHASPSEDEE